MDGLLCVECVRKVVLYADKGEAEFMSMSGIWYPLKRSNLGVIANNPVRIKGEDFTTLADTISNGYACCVEHCL